MVELLNSYSNRGEIRSDRLRRLIVTASSKLDPLPSSPDRPRQRQVRLSPAQRAELVERYLAGETMASLSAAFDVGRETVGRILGEVGVEPRYRVRDRLDLDEIRRRYESSESLATIGVALGVDAETIRQTMIGAGIPRRPRRGR